jgi:hypothetical protein
MGYEIPEHLIVEGVRDLGELGVANQSSLLVPAEFDKEKYVGRWTFVGASAERARQVQRIQGTRHAVDGWEVFKYPPDHKEAGKPCIRPLGDKQAILLFRPKELQHAVNAIHGNISRERMIAEHEGRTISGQPVRDGSMLNEKALRRYDPATEAADPPNYGFNAIPAAAKPRGGRARATTKTR